MSTPLQGQLRAMGAVQVIVILKVAETNAEIAAALEAIKRHFLPEAAEDSALERNPSGEPAMRYYPHLGVVLGTVDRSGYQALRADQERIASVSAAPALSLIRPRRVAAARLTRKVSWGIDSLEVPALWKEGLTGKGVVIGHLDTGADGRHPALRGALHAFTVFDRLGREVRPAPAPFDSDEHGTHTAATLAGRPVRGRAVGVAPGAQLACAVVIEGGNAMARVLGGMDWALGLGARLLSMSLGFRGWWEEFLPLTRILRERNVLPVFAVGNEGPGTSRSPGNYSEALSVGAIDESGGVADFSSSQSFKRKRDPVVPDLVAPGVSIISARPGGGYQSMDGTSMATPHIAGLAALLWEAKPEAGADQIEAALFRSCAQAPRFIPQRGGRGVPGARRALKELEAEEHSPLARRPDLRSNALAG
ncbi:MAG: S8 family serine peptidase [Planctomycetes bacterium]|nr:S8 family serine peptidase [Planctomycetota bacterium]